MPVKVRKGKGKKVKTPHIQYARVYPAKRHAKRGLAREEGIWDGRPKRARVAEGFYDQVKRRGMRTRYKEEEPKRVVKRKKVAMVPAGARAVNRMKDG